MGGGGGGEGGRKVGEGSGKNGKPFNVIIAEN